MKFPPGTKKKLCILHSKSKKTTTTEVVSHSRGQAKPSQSQAEGQTRQQQRNNDTRGEAGAAGFKPLKLLRRLQSAPHSVTYGAIWSLSRSLWAANLKQQMVPNKRFTTILGLGLFGIGQQNKRKIATPTTTTI